jgi:signal transduction histidine kinase
VLGELLHSLSQPLTGLRCSLELSLELSLDRALDEIAEQQQESVSAALQQTEKVIGMIQLMREYLDAEQPEPVASPAELAPAMRSVVEELATIAEVRGIQLRLVGTCRATLPVREPQLRLALQYLIATTIEAQPAGGRVTLLLGEGPAGAVLRAEGERSVREFDSCAPDSRAPNSRDQDQGATMPPAERDPASATNSSASVSISVSTLRRVRLAIASRVLEAAGASLVFGDSDSAGFVLRIPH